MPIVQATYRDGVFAPDGAVPLAEGAKVTLSFQPTAASDVENRDSAVSVDALIDFEEAGVPFDLPMLTSGKSVRCAADAVPLPDAPIFREPSTVE